MTDASRRLAVIDVGTNSVRLFSVAFENDEIRVLDEFGEVTRLGAALSETGAIAAEDAERTQEVLRICLERARNSGADEVDIAGTEVFRAASNGAETAAAFSRALDHEVRILSPEDEAEASYLGVVGWGDAGDHGVSLILDVGGGSTEVVFGEGVALQAARSVPLGALRITASFLGAGPHAETGLAKARAHIDAGLKPVLSLKGKIPAGARWIGVGGTACAIGAWVHHVVPYDPAGVHGRPVTREALNGVIREWSSMDVAEIMKGGQMSEGRASVVLGGALIFERILEGFRIEAFQVSAHGLRHGLILRRLLLG